MITLDSTEPRYETSFTNGAAERIDLYYSAELPEVTQYLQGLLGDARHQMNVANTKKKYCIIMLTGSMLLNIFLSVALLLIGWI